MKRKCICTICGKEFDTDRKTKIPSCSVECRYKKHAIVMRGRMGENSSNWKGGICYFEGRKYIYDPSNPMAKVNGNYVNEARMIMSKKLGRVLGPRENVHHIDGNKSNNSIDNLVVLSVGSHTSFHASNRSEDTKLKMRISSNGHRDNVSGRFV